MKYDFFKNRTADVQDGKAVSGAQIINPRAIRQQIKNDALHYRKARELDELCIRPKPGEQWRLVTEKQFNAYAAILSTISAGLYVDEMYLSIYRINQPTVLSLIELIEEGKIKKANFLISDFFNATKRPEKWANQLRQFATNHPNCRHAYINTHAKILCMLTSSGDHIVLEGSGNMSDNARIEQYLYENNKETYDFHSQWMTEILEKHG